MPVRRARAVARSVVAAGLVCWVVLGWATPAGAGPAPSGPAPSESGAVGSAARAIGDAGTGLAVIRLLPGAASGQQQSASELGVGLASAQANSEAALAYEHAVAQAAPAGVVVAGGTPQLPGGLVQTALPDNAEPVTGGLAAPTGPLAALASVGALTGSAHARWSEQAGPCVGDIATASTSLASLSALTAIPALPSQLDLTGLLQPTRQLPDPAMLVDALKNLAAPLSRLGGLLSGTPGGAATGALVSLPDALSAHASVSLVDAPGVAGKAVRSTSTLQVGGIRLLAGSPMELRVDVVSAPTLTVTATGDEATSSVSYQAPVLRVSQGGRELGTLDANKSTMDIPVKVLPGTDFRLPAVGELLPDGTELTAGLSTIDIGVLRLRTGGPAEKKSVLAEPFTGFQLGATARLLDLQLLPTDRLALPNLPAALVQVALGEQIARAAAPAGGVRCAAAAPPADQPPAPAGGGAPTPPLARTSAATGVVPLFWAGTAALFAGVVLVAATPPRRGRATRGTPESTRPRGPVG